MIQNKQVSIWRGNSTPPTLYHLWFKNEEQLLRYDDEQKKWVVFLDSNNLDIKIAEFLNALDAFSINGKSIKDNPVLDGYDIKIEFNGNYIKRDQTVSEALQTLDGLLTTKVYGQ